MSPVGIPYLSLASDLTTCLAEVRPDVGDKVWVAEFTPLAPLKLIDLMRIPEYKRLSIFDENYDNERYVAGSFMEAFSKEISKPVKLTASATEYIPTQVLAELIKHQGYNGIKFASSQNPDGWNLVLLDGPTPEDCRYSELCKRYHHWLRLKWSRELTIGGVRYKYSGSKRQRHKTLIEPTEHRPRF